MQILLLDIASFIPKRKPGKFFLLCFLFFSSSVYIIELWDFPSIRNALQSFVSVSLVIFASRQR